MLTRDELASMMNSSPHFGAVKSAFDVSKTYNSLVGFAHIFSPLLGSGASVPARVPRLQPRAREERSTGSNYTWLVFSRLEHAWLAPHPPLELLDPELLWMPSPDGHAGTDRHATMARRFGSTYFRRFELLTSDRLFDVLPLKYLSFVGPEEALERLLIAQGVPVGYFPHTFDLAQCAVGEGSCWNNGHEAARRWQFATCPEVHGDDEVPSPRRKRPWEVWATSWYHRASEGCYAMGKYSTVRVAAAYSAFQQCHGTSWRVDAHRVALPAAARELSPASWLERRWEFKGYSTRVAQTRARPQRASCFQARGERAEGQGGWRRRPPWRRRRRRRRCTGHVYDDLTWTRRAALSAS